MFARFFFARFFVHRFFVWSFAMPPVLSTCASKRTSLSLDTKQKILQEIDKNILTKTEIAAQFKIPKSTLSTIIKNREKISKARNAGMAPDRSRTREAKYPEMETALLEWLRTMRAKNVPIDGNVLKTKADLFALRLNLAGFTASDGWMQRFKTRHGLLFRKLCGESAAVDLNSVSTWKENTLKRLLNDFNKNDIFNADETGLFFKMLPDKSLIFKGDACNGGKHAKERITILLAANMSGTEKLPLLIIGKSKKPRCFKGIKTLPAKYDANKKAWMTAQIFEEWIVALDRKMTQQGRKILLVIDNCTAHGQNIHGLKAIRIEFLPPNTTSIMQPLDQGIIQAFKKQYRKMLLNRMVFCLEQGKDHAIDLLGAIHLASASWNAVSQSTVSNCFRHAGFETAEDKASRLGTAEGESERDAIAAADNEGEELLQALRKHVELPETTLFSTYVDIDSNLGCSEEISEETILQRVISARTSEINSDDNSENEDDVETEAVPRPTLKQASDAAETLRKFFETEENSENFLKVLMDMEKCVWKSVGRLKQSSITDFLSS